MLQIIHVTQASTLNSQIQTVERFQKLCLSTVKVSTKPDCNLLNYVAQYTTITA